MKRGTESPAIAGCGPACPVEWEGRSRDTSPQSRLPSSGTERRPLANNLIEEEFDQGVERRGLRQLASRDRRYEYSCPDFRPILDKHTQAKMLCVLKTEQNRVLPEVNPGLPLNLGNGTLSTVHIFS